MKYVLNEAFIWAGLESGTDVECEVFGEFSHLIPKAELEKIPRGRDRQVMVPDFSFHDEAMKGWCSVLAELKVISCGRTYYTLTAEHPRAAWRSVLGASTRSMPGRHKKPIGNTAGCLRPRWGRYSGTWSLLGR